MLLALCNRAEEYGHARSTECDHSAQAGAVEQRQTNRGKAAVAAQTRLVDPDKAPDRRSSNAADPFGDEPGVLACRHTSVRTAMAGKQELAGSFAGGFYIVIDRLASLVASFERTCEVP
jgi:hypothetical protein